MAALLSAALDATGHPVLVAAALGFVAVLIAATRWVTCRVRERREDAADAAAGAAWRAQNMPGHPLNRRGRAGVA